MAVAKWQVYADLQRGGFEEARLVSDVVIDVVRQHPDSLEGVRSFAERRPPMFPPLPPGFDVASEVARRTPGGPTVS